MFVSACIQESVCVSAMSDLTEWLCRGGTSSKSSRPLHKHLFAEGTALLSVVYQRVAQEIVCLVFRKDGLEEAKVGIESFDDRLLRGA